MATYGLSGPDFRRVANVVRKVEGEVSVIEGKGFDPRAQHTHIRRFELKEDMSDGAATDAYILKWNTVTQTYDRVTEGSTYATMTVADVSGRFNALTGEKGICWKPYDRDVWEIILSQTVQRCSATLPTALASTGISISGCTLTATDGNLSPSGTYTIYNRRNLASGGGYEGASGETAYVEYNSNTSHWEIYDMACPAST